jgi:hypothetical protein
MPATLNCMNAPFVRCGNKFNLVLTVMTLAQVMHQGYGGGWRSLCLPGVWSLDPGGRFCDTAFGRHLASFAMKIFSLLIYFERNPINFYFQ